MRLLSRKSGMPQSGDGGRFHHQKLHGIFTLPVRLIHRLNSALERYLPEQRLFLKSETETRFVRLKPLTQALALGGGATLIAWTIVASAIFFMDAISSGNARDQARRSQAVFEERLDALSAERDARAAEALAAQERFSVALAQVSAMQSQVLALEERRKELETGIGVIQATLRRSMNERDEAREEAEEMRLAMSGEATGGGTPEMGTADLTATLDIVTAALGSAASERDALAREAGLAVEEAEAVAYEMRLMEERHDDIFAQLEEAVTISMEPLDRMFTEAGLDPKDLIDEIRTGYSGLGGPATPLMPTVSTSGRASSDAYETRADRILEGLDRMNMYRIAAEKSPFALPLKTSFRFTSGFGRRWGRMHEGVDLAGGHGSPVMVTADGTVVHAGWENGYGKLVTVRHAFGMETRYGHLSDIHVNVGDKVSRGDRIGDMGNTGRSTGTHLHYEVRVGGNAVNPMTFIKAGTNVF